MKATKAWNLLTIQIGNLEEVLDTDNDIGFHAYAQNRYAISCVKKEISQVPKLQDEHTLLIFQNVVEQ